jgi:DNA-directed RNA polymerase subunit K/omega
MSKAKTVKKSKDVEDDIYDEDLSSDESDNDVDIDDLDDDKESVVEETSDVETLKDESDDEELIKNIDEENDDGEDETCLYKIKNKKQKILETDDLDDGLFENDKLVLTKRIVKPEERITKPILFKYERVRILSERRQQLIYGAKPMVRVPKNIAEKEIADLELKAKVIPFIISRTLPNGDTEHWRLDELEIIN